MCKVFALAGFKKEDLPKVMELAKEATTLMKRNPDNDGVGYAAITSSGQVFGEKWLEPENAWKTMKAANKTGDDIIKKHLASAITDKVVSSTEKYATFGVAGDDVVGLILHTRNSTTGGKNIQNTHPFYLPETETNPALALIHNGSIVNHEKLTKVYSTCDSETILHEYNSNSMYWNPYAIDKMSKDLRGLYTVALLGHYLGEDQTIVPYMDMIRSNKDLVFTYVNELGTFLFATNAEIIEEPCKKVGLTHGSIFEVENGKLIRINALTGLPDIEVITFTASEQYAGYTNTYGTHHHNNQNWDRGHKTHQSQDDRTVVPIGSKSQDMKTSFHEDFLSDDYFVCEELSSEDRERLRKAEESGDVRAKAIILVQSAIEAKRA